MEKTNAVTFKRAYQAQVIWRNYPPNFSDKNKQLVYNLAYPEPTTPKGQITVVQTAVRKYPDGFGSQPEIDVRPDFYDYKISDPDAVEWHVNFADSRLFAFYGRSLFAQDEIQTCEHPVLASVREALAIEGLAFTRENHKPFPVLLKNCERRCQFDLKPKPKLGLPKGLYGNEFTGAGAKAIKECTTLLEPPISTNIIAMAAPSGGSKKYTVHEINDILSTAYSAFDCAAKFDDSGSSFLSPEESKIVIHTGWWGTGAFGGDRELMALLQYVAATLAGISKIVFHAPELEFVDTAHKAFAKAQDLISKSNSVNELIESIEKGNYQWGVSNGT